MAQEKVFVIAHSEDAFRAFKTVQPKIASLCIRVKEPSDLALSGTNTVVTVGPFWRHPHIDALMEIVRRQTRVSPTIGLQWFPM